MDKNIEIVADAVNDIISADATTFTLNAVKVGTVAHTRNGTPIEFTAEALERMAPTFVGGFIKYNHNEMGEGEILTSEWRNPFIAFKIGGLCSRVSKMIAENRHTGFSIDARGNPDDPTTYTGEGISVLYGSHSPACNPEQGCGVTGKIMPEEPNVAEIVADKLHIDTLESKLAETEALLAEKVTAAESLFTKEQMGAAEAAAIEASVATKETITAAKGAVTGMFPKGMEEKFEAEVMELIEAEDYHGAIVKLGDIDFTPIEASVPTEGTTDSTETIEASETKTALDAALAKLNSKFIGA